MATLDKTGTLAQLRGRVGGTVVSSNGQAAYVKAYAPPVRPRTPAQQEQRRLLAAAALAWQTDGLPYVAAWAAAAADPAFTRYDWFGNPYQMTAQQLYVATWLCLQRVTVPVLSLPPAASTPPTPPTAVAVLRSSISPGPCQLALSPSSIAPGDYVLVDARLQTGFRALALNGPYSPLCYFTSDDLTPQDIKPLLVAKYGLLPKGYLVFFATYTLRPDGRLSMPVTSRFAWDIDNE